MAGSLPKFGRIDLEVDGSSGAVTTPPRAPAPAPGPKRAPTFGELDLESIIGAAEYERPKPFVPTTPLRPTRQSLEAVTRLAAEETRIAKAGALDEAVALSRRPPAPPPLVDGESCTRIGSFNAAIDGLVVEDAPSSRRTPPSASGVASRDDRVAAMRELYAQGNADAALALASSVVGDLGEASTEGDPYGGLIPIDEPSDDSEAGEESENGSQYEDHTAIVEACADSSRLAALTSRQVPRLLVGPKEISKLPMDPRAAFILSHIDGVQSMEEILDVCAMPEAEAIELIEWLRALEVIGLD